MHETLVVAVRAREVVQIELFVRENCPQPCVSSNRRTSAHSRTFPLLLRNAGYAGLRWHGHRPNVVIVIVFLLRRHSRGISVYCFRLFLATSCSLSEDRSLVFIFGHADYNARAVGRTRVLSK